MTTHSLKIWPEHFDSARIGEKPYELRQDDRSYADGDMLFLQEWNPTTKAFTGRTLERRVTHILRGPTLGLAAGWVILGLGRKGR